MYEAFGHFVHMRLNQDNPTRMVKWIRYTSLQPQASRPIMLPRGHRGSRNTESLRMSGEETVVYLNNILLSHMVWYCQSRICMRIFYICNFAIYGGLHMTIYMILD